MNTFNNICSFCTAVGLAVFAGSYLFSAGSLTALGWVIMLPLFAGSTGHILIGLYNLIPQSVKDKVSKAGPGIDATKAQPA